MYLKKVRSQKWEKIKYQVTYGLIIHIFIWPKLSEPWFLYLLYYSFFKPWFINPYSLVHTKAWLHYTVCMTTLSLNHFSTRLRLLTSIHLLSYFFSASDVEILLGSNSIKNDVYLILFITKCSYMDTFVWSILYLTNLPTKSWLENQTMVCYCNYTELLFK